MFAELVDGLVGSTDAEIDAALRQIELESRRVEARRAAVLAVAEAQRSYAADGHRTMRNYVAATCNSSPATNLRERRRAQLLGASEEVGEALLIGRIGVSQVDELAAVFANRRVADELIRALPALVECAERMTFDDFRTCLKRWVTLVDLEGSLRELDESVEGRTASVSVIADELHVSVSGGDPVTAASIEAVFGQFVDAEFRADCQTRRDEHGDEAHAHPLPRTAEQRRFDAFATMVATASEAATADGRFPEPVVNILVDHDTVDEAFTRAGVLLPNGRQIDLSDMTGDQVKRVIDELTADPARLIDRRCETESGIVLHPLLVLQAALTAHVRRVVIDSVGRVVDLGRERRLFTGGARVAAQLAARHCSHPGCDVPALRCDVDHVDEWVADDGRTDQRNADPKCGVHDRFKHRERWTSRRSEHGRVYTRRADGTIVLPVGEREPDLSFDEAERLIRKRMEALIAERSRQPRAG